MIALANARKAPVDSDAWVDLGEMDRDTRAIAIRWMLYGIGRLAHRIGRQWEGTHREAAKLMLEIERQAKVVTRRPPEHVPAFPCKYPMWTDPIISEAEEG